MDNTFGILVQKFIIYNRRIQTKPENVDIIIFTTCILHNIIKIHDDKIVYPRDLSTNQETTTTITLENIPMQGGNASQEAFRTRETFKAFFKSSAGSIPWQNDSI